MHTGPSVLGMFFILVVFVLSLASTAFWVWMVVDCATNETNEGNNRLIWILVIVIAGVIGAIVYFFARRSQRMTQMGR